MGNFTHLGLFEGIGGFSLAARWMGWQTVAWCEWEPFCQTVLKHHFPNAIGHGDIKQFDATPYAGQIDILTGGFPCQPYSTAGKRLGKEDDRHLWPEMLRIIREVRPRYVVGENVAGLLSWNGGLVFDEVQTDLEAEGYEVWAFVLPACAVDAPHRRDRVWFVAHAKSDNNRRNAGAICATYEQAQEERQKERVSKFASSGFGAFENANQDGRRSKLRQSQSSERKQWNACTGDNKWICANNGKDWPTSNACGTGWEKLDNAAKPGFAGHSSGCCIADAANAESERLSQWNGEQAREQGANATTKRHSCIPEWSNFPTQSPVCGRNDGVSTGLAGITVSKHRRESLKAYGNAIVPQVAYQIFKAIEETEWEISKDGAPKK
jgi:DNA (cytosine-5)-methyltransferase 1